MEKKEKQITILIADDNAFMRECLRSVISLMPSAQVIGEAANGEQAIKLALEFSPDIILMDINMAPVNGFEATRKIIKDNPQSKIIGISDNQKISYVENMKKLGAKGYVIKTSSFETIIEAITKVSAGENYFDKEIKNIN